MMEEKVAPRAAEIDEKAELPWDVIELFKANQVFNLVAPQEYGGLDGQLLTLCVAIEEVSRVCGSSSMILGNQSLGAGPIALWGNEAQKEKYLPGIADGEIFASFALTEPNAGSDVAGIQSRAVLKGDRYIINGNKCFITHADIADVFAVFAKVSVEGKDKITAFLIDAKTPGVSVGKKEKKMGLRGSSTCSMNFEDVEVPVENILGKIGDGYRVALDCLDKGRIMTGSMAVGIAQGAMEFAADFAQTRHQFGKPISDNQGIQFMLADMATEIEVARAMVRTAAWNYDNHTPDMMKFSAMAKLYATDMVMRATTDAVQIMGGYGYCRDYPVERMMRDAKIFAIFEGANQIQRLVIARALLK
jgi:alkylation response protein AidB-like acyl-CoA dehydrogenase